MKTQNISGPRHGSKKIGWLARLSLGSVRHPRASLFIWLAIVVFGLLSYTRFMQREGFPDVAVPISTVSGTYFVSDKTLVDSEVVKPILATASRDSRIIKTTATALDNGFSIVVQYKDGTNVISASEELKNNLSRDANIPVSAQINYSTINAGKFLNKYDSLISVSNNTVTTEQLQLEATAYADSLSRKIAPSSAVLLPAYENGTNPVNGQVVTQLKSFDFTALRSGGNLEPAKQSIIIGITSPSGTDVVKFDSKLSSAIKDLESDDNYKNLNVTIAADQASSIKEQINLLQDNLLEGLVIVALICMFFISARAGIVAALGMIGTLAMTLSILFILGISLNTITLFGLILCLGLIVDDTVIMAEALDKYKDSSRNFNETVKTAASHVAVASLTGTLTTILAFMPLLFVSGVLGEFIRVLPITIIISLAVSLLASITLVPFLASKIDRKPQKDFRKTLARFNPFRWVELAISETASSIIIWANKPSRKIIVTFIAIGISIQCIILGTFYMGSLKFDIFPSAKDSDAILITAAFYPGSSIEQNIELSKAINTTIVDTIGANVERISYTGSGSASSAKIQIKLSPYSERDQTARSLIAKLDPELSKIKSVNISTSQVDAGPVKDSMPFKVQIASSDRDSAAGAAKKIQEYLLGREVMRTNGSTASITKVDYSGNKPSLSRVNGVPIVEVSAGFDAEDTSALVQLTEQDVKNFISSEQNRAGLSPNDYSFDFGSESSNQDSFKTVIFAFPILFLTMFILLALQFRSVTQPILIFMAIPFSLFGVGLGLSITNNPISFFVMVGFFALIGISVNNTILLTDFANQRRKLGDSPREAIASALSARVRPLLTTSITAVVALIPLALTNPFWESLSVTLIFGLLSSTFLVLVAFPYYYLIFESVRSRLIIKVYNKK
jgi:HAE1 family hydrophobic/amphiphilic exporter-1